MAKCDPFASELLALQLAAPDAYMAIQHMPWLPSTYAQPTEIAANITNTTMYYGARVEDVSPRDKARMLYHVARRVLIWRQENTRDAIEQRRLQP